MQVRQRFSVFWCLASNGLEFQCEILYIHLAKSICQQDDLNVTLHYITLQTIYSGLSKSNFKGHYGDAATQQCLGYDCEINQFSVSNEML